MSDSWCKVASNLDAHPRIRKAGRDGRDVFLFALRRNAEPNHKTPGRLKAEDLDPDYLADILMMPRDAAVTGVTAAVTAGLLRVDGDFFVLVGWGEDWGKKPAGGTERTRKWRENKKIQTDTDSVTGVTSTNVTRDVGDESDALDKTRVEEIDRSGNAPPAKKPRSSKLKAQVPEDWRPTSHLDSWQEAELVRFRNHHRSKGNTFVDCSLAWTNWLSRASQFGNGQAQQPLGGIRQKNQIA